MEEKNQQSEFNQSVFDNFWKNFVLPEIEQRQEKGELQKPVTVTAFQIIFFGDGKTPYEVRINKEVKIADVDIKLIDEEKDNGHVTWFRVDGNRWIGQFNLVYNRGTIGELKLKAEQFLTSAKHSFDNQLWAPMIDNLYSATELSSKAISIAFSGRSSLDPALENIAIDSLKKKSTSHNNIQIIFNKLKNYSLVEPEYAALLNKLKELRIEARYKNRFEIDENVADQLLRDVQDILGNIDNYMYNPFFGLYAKKQDIIASE